MTLTFGVEEEFLFADASTHELREDAAGIVENASAARDEDLDHELRSAMAETGTAVCRDSATLAHELSRSRRALVDVAAERGAVVLATGTHPSARAHRAGYSDDDRYQRMAEEYGRLADDALVCGCHVHVQVPDREAGVRVIDSIGGWLPALLALSANSPYWEGSDTRFDSWRTQVWSRWPTAGPTSQFGTLEAYERRADELTAIGAALDRGMLYYAARLSESYPTVEIRVADVCLDQDDAVLIAVLSRALVMTALDSDPTPAVPVELLRAATFTAARHGLNGPLLDPAVNSVAPAANVLERLTASVRPALDDTGDYDLVREGISRVIGRGNGATQQRQAQQRGGPSALRDAITVG